MHLKRPKSSQDLFFFHLQFSTCKLYQIVGDFWLHISELLFYCYFICQYWHLVQLRHISVSVMLFTLCIIFDITFCNKLLFCWKHLHATFPFSVSRPSTLPLHRFLICDDSTENFFSACESKNCDPNIPHRHDGSCGKPARKLPGRIPCAGGRFFVRSGPPTGVRGKKFILWVHLYKRPFEGDGGELRALIFMHTLCI